MLTFSSFYASACFTDVHRIAVTTRYLINKARLFFVKNFVFGLTKNIRQNTNRLHSHPHTNLLQNTLNRLGEILHMGNHSHDFRLLGFAFRASRPSFAMKSWISICNQGVIDRTYFDDELKKDEIRTINNTLITNGYPRFHRKRRPTRSESESQQTKIMTVVPHVQNLTEPIKRVLQQVGVGVAIKPVCVLSNIFCKPKDKVFDKEKSGLVYQISCRDCDAVYIGETGRSLETRKREHINAVKNFDLKKVCTVSACRRKWSFYRLG